MEGRNQLLHVSYAPLESSGQAHGILPADLRHQVMHSQRQCNLRPNYIVCMLG
jgi:hypothetical protein